MELEREFLKNENNKDRYERKLQDGQYTVSKIRRMEMIVKGRDTNPDYQPNQLSHCRCL